MKLYLVQFDHEPYYVEAENFAGAIEAWKRHVKERWALAEGESEEPESVACVHDEAVIR